jgi:hypothetical protein
MGEWGYVLSEGAWSTPQTLSPSSEPATDAVCDLPRAPHRIPHKAFTPSTSSATPGATGLVPRRGYARGKSPTLGQLERSRCPAVQRPGTREMRLTR